MVLDLLPSNGRGLPIPRHGIGSTSCRAVLAGAVGKIGR